MAAQPITIAVNKLFLDVWAFKCPSEPTGTISVDCEGPDAAHTTTATFDTSDYDGKLITVSYYGGEYEVWGEFDGVDTLRFNSFANGLIVRSITYTPKEEDEPEEGDAYGFLTDKSKAYLGLEDRMRIRKAKAFILERTDTTVDANGFKQVSFSLPLAENVKVGEVGLTNEKVSIIGITNELQPPEGEQYVPLFFGRSNVNMSRYNASFYIAIKNFSSSAYVIPRDNAYISVTFKDIN